MKLYVFNFWNGVAIVTLLAILPEFYAYYEADKLLKYGEITKAKEHHAMAAFFGTFRSIRLLESITVSA